VEYVQSTLNAVLAGPSTTEYKSSCTYTFPADVDPVLWWWHDASHQQQSQYLLYCSSCCKCFTTIEQEQSIASTCMVLSALLN